MHIAQSRAKGYTLAEIIVVIAAMALIMTGVIVGVTKIRERSRDARRISDVRQLMTALETYYYTNKTSPSIITPGQPLISGSTTYLDRIPTNPQPRTDGNCPDKDFQYVQTNGNKDYQITFCIGNGSQNFKKGINICEHGNCTACDDYIIKDRDGYEYTTIQIGGQCWMAQNLKTKTGPDGNLLTTGSATSQRDCISASNTRGTEEDCDARGALYNFNTAKTICPTGWHLPTDFEWRPMESYLTDSGNDCVGNRGYWGSSCGELTSPTGCLNAGTKLKEGGTSGFEWQLTGRRTVNSSLVSSFTEAGTKGYAWSTSLTGGNYSCFTGGIPNGRPYNYAAVRSVSNASTGVIRDMIPLNFWNLFGNTEVVYTDYQALPVRCVKDY